MNKETSEIAKLTERVSKDPKSKLFVPLAEEYKKAGDIEMAIYVLSEGLKNNPGYVTARSILGKLLLETEDFAGAQKEFEEVVKAIPDNLLAQRKLGDLCALQSRPDEALKHYKTVFSFNPRDAELASLISDLEAGRDVKPRLHLLKSRPSPGKAGKPETPATSPEQAKPKAPSEQVSAAATTAEHPRPDISPGKAGTEEVREERTAAASIASSRAPETIAQAETAWGAASPGPAEEEAEEVLAIEPLEEPAPEPEPNAPGFDFLEERDQKTITTPPVEELTETGFAEAGQIETEQPVAVHIPSAAEMLTEPGAEEPLASAAGVLDEIDIVEAEIEAEPSSGFPEPVPAEPQEEASEKSDDFTTDTLAELYIAQGFYEKAIDIYERMLADKPENRGLKEKLERVRSMAGGAGSAAVGPAEEAKELKVSDTNIFAEANEYIPPADGEQTAASAELRAGPGEQAPAPEEEKPSESGKPAGFDIFASSPASEYVPRSEPFSTDFEPGEYAPPKTGPEPFGAKAGGMHAAPTPLKASKKDTIARLESWLQNIKKEK